MEKYRTRILQLLYEERKRNPLAGMDSQALAQKLGIPWDQIRSEVTYLEEKQYISLKSRHVGTRIFISLQITALGIDFLESKINESVQINISFKVQLSLRDERQFEVRVVNQTPMGEPVTLSQLPYSTTELVTILKALHTAKYDPNRFTSEQNKILRQSGLMVNSHLVQDMLSRVGQTLYNALMSGDVDTAFQMSLNLVKSTKGTVALQLRFDENAIDLAQYPWELLFHRRALLPSGMVELTRYISYPEAVTKLSITPPLQLLYIQSRPTNLKLLDDAEQVIAQKALAELEKENLLKVDILPESTYEALLDYLETNTVHILHFDGHGVFAWQCPRCEAMNYPYFTNCQARVGGLVCNQANIGITPKGYLAFEHEDSQTDWISNEDLSYLFNKHPLQLAVLSACRSGTVGGETLFTGIGPSLIQSGVPAVVSTQLPITVNAAAKFMEGFYRALARFESLPTAVNAGRLRIIRTHEWFIPTLYLRSKDDEGFIFTQI